MVQFMTESAADGTAVENAYRDIDRHISEMSQPSSNDPVLLSPSERLRVLVKQQQSAAREPVTPLSANEF
jgi:hypothetical protein